MRFDVNLVAILKVETWNKLAKVTCWEQDACVTLQTVKETENCGSKSGRKGTG